MHLKIDDEPIDLFWDRLMRDLEEVAASQGLGSLPYDLIGSAILDVLADHGDDVVELVTVPTDGTGKSVLKFRISAGFEQRVTEVALHVIGIDHRIPHKH